MFNFDGVNGREPPFGLITKFLLIKFCCKLTHYNPCIVTNNSSSHKGRLSPIQVLSVTNSLIF